MPLDARIAPDGGAVTFAWMGDVWIADLDGAAPARRLTTHPATDRRPLVAPAGDRVLFVSDRSGTDEVWIVPIAGGTPTQVTRGGWVGTPVEWLADGSGFLAVATGDDSPFSTEARRVQRVALDQDRAPVDLVDAGTNTGTLSPDGTHLLFVRGRVPEFRKGHRGAASEQIWLADLTADGAPALTRHTADLEDFQNVSERDPIWWPDGQGYWFVSDPDGAFDLYSRRLADGAVQRVTDVRKLDGSDDGVVAPSASADGRRILFRRRFDLALLDVASGAIRPVDLRARTDTLASPIERRRLDGAETVAFTDDGKQIALVAGHDLYVMDRVLREPQRVTTTPAVEADLVFADGGKRLYFTSEASGEVDVWEATCDDPDGYWWRPGASFTLRKVTDDRAVESRLVVSPTGEHIAYLKDRDLWVMDADGTDHRRVFASWDGPDFDWSPDGRWLCWSVMDGEFNDEVWVAPLDGSRPPFNLSRHPDRDSSPRWSADGSRIAWVGRRDGEESDIYYVTLTRDVAEETERDRKLREALEAMGGKKKGGKGDGEKKSESGEDAPAAEASDGPQVTIDFDGIHDRIGRIRISDSREFGLLWSPKGATLLFQATVDGERGLYKVEFPDELSPKKVAGDALRGARWLAAGNQIVGQAGSTPASANPSSGKVDRFGFQVAEERDWREIRRLAFDQGWRAMRDSFYDGSTNNRDWSAIRDKYRPVAAELLGRAEFSELMNMMLGELNASHLGHRGGADPLPPAPRPDWTPRAHHLGLRFDRGAGGPGLLVASVIPEGPTDQDRSRVAAGERVLAIDGNELAPERAIEPHLTFGEARDVVLKVRSAGGDEREVTVRPIPSVRGLLYEEWVEAARAKVEELSKGRLGYLHIRGMNDSSFKQMEEDLYHAGYGKDGLIVDVRFNGGGSTADHVLTALCQPRHAITVPRGGPQGYPQDRKVYASWHKPIVLMCNEMSFSNAEILAHAINTLDRGPVVGMRTAGGVISTGSSGLVDGSYVRMPFRGWYVLADGQDMELNGAMPDVALWNAPDGDDAQLARAVQVLQDEVANAPEDPELVPASSRGK